MNDITNLEIAISIISGLGLMVVIILFSRFFLAKRQGNFFSAELNLKAGILMIVLVTVVTGALSLYSRTLSNI